MDKGLSPNVSVRPRGVVEKCNFCHSRYLDAKNEARQNGEDPMNLADGAYNPACADICPTKAITFGDLNNPEHRVYELSRGKNAFRLLEKLGLDPQVYYTSEREWVRLQGDNYNADGGGH